MPFRRDFGAHRDERLRSRLQDVLEFVWLALIDHGVTAVSRERIARMIIAADESGMAPECIKDRLIRKLTRPAA